LYAPSHYVRDIKSRRMKWARRVARIVEMRNVYSISVRKPEGKRPLRSPRRRWEDNIRMDLKDIGWEGMYWRDLTRDRD